ncbi:MAG: ribonuclease H-like domain-containing protein [Candidatus Zixiibacteriota bacterium]
MLRDKLNRFSGDIAKSNQKLNPVEVPERYATVANSLGGYLVATDTGSFVKITTDFKDNYCHGRMMILDLDLSSEFSKKHFYYNREEVKLKSKKLLFFDMETTGLGGAGTVPFLIGFGSVTENGFQVRQYFLPDFPDEEAMLTAVREEINDQTVIVSYNGKAFDMPILSDRLVLHRIERNLLFADHIDLLHTVRRMYRLRLQSCTLSNIEAKILDFRRHNDIPGALVPAIYFNWLNYDDVTDLTGVVQHNLYDIVSLFFLMHHLEEIRINPEEKITEPDDVLSLAKIIHAGKNHEDVCRTLESFNNITGYYDRYDIMFFHSMAYKRSGQLDEAVSLWNKIAHSGSPESFSALVELSKYYEHKTKDCQRAIECALAAQEILPQAPSIRQDLKKRINRLNRKVCR